MFIQPLEFGERHLSRAGFDRTERQSESGQGESDGDPEAKGASVKPIGVAISSPTSTSDEWLKNK